MIAQRIQQDTQDQVNDSVPREQYEEVRRIAEAMVYWAELVNIQGSSALNDVRFKRDMQEAYRLGLRGDR